LETFTFLVTGFFLVTVITDSFRPANASSIAQYSKPKNLTKAYSLNRMAVNLGFALGPAVGGFLAAKSFGLLFLADGLTCFAAALVFIGYFYKRQKAERDARDKARSEDLSIAKNPYRDLVFILFCICTFGFGVVFFQLLNTLPLYYSQGYELNETVIGYLLALNGFLVFLLEMPLVDSLSKKNALRAIVTTGTLMAGISYLIFNFSSGMLILIAAMILLSISEILVMPFLTTYTVNRAGNKSRGKYLGLYGMSYSLALIVAPALGTYLVDLSGFTMLWYTMFGISILAALGFIAVIKPGDN
jgi:predicted MFS family arabinose efflux permease